MFTHLNLEFYQLQATYTKTGRPAQWALATWAPEGPVSSAEAFFVVVIFNNIEEH